jgi:hypothetical protein
MHNVALDVLLQRRNNDFYEECKGCDKEHTVL